MYPVSRDEVEVAVQRACLHCTTGGWIHLHYKQDRFGYLQLVISSGKRLGPGEKIAWFSAVGEAGHKHSVFLDDMALS